MRPNRHAVQPALHVKARDDGMFVVLDRDQKLRFKAATLQAAQEWMATATARPVRRELADVAGSHAAHTVGMGEG